MIIEKGKLPLVFLFFLFAPLLAEGWILEATIVPRFIIASLFLALGLAYQRYKSSGTFSFPPILGWLLALFYLIHLISLFWSFNIADGLFESQKILIGIGTFLFFHQFLQDENRSKRLLPLLLVMALSLSVYGLFEYLNTLYEFSPDYSTLAGHANLLSSALYLTLPFCLMGLRLNLPWRIIAYIALGLTLALIFLLGTRSVYLALLIATTSYLILRWSLQLATRMRRIIWSGYGVALASFFIFLLANGGLLTRSFSENTSASMTERMHLWQKTEQLIYDYPLTGIGAGNWQYNYAQYGVNNIEKSHYYNVFFKRPHNDFLWVFSETGLVGFLLLLLIIAYLTRNALKQLIIRKEDSYLLFLFAGLTGVLVISFFSFPKERILHICLIALMLAYLTQKSLPQQMTKRNKFSQLAPFVLVGGLFFNIYIGFMRLKGEYYTQKAITAQRNNNPDQAIDNSLKALSFFYSSDPSCTPVLSYAGWGYNIKTQLPELLAVSEEAYHLSPYDYKVLNNYGYALMRVHRTKEAEQILREANRIHSRYEPVIINLSALAFNDGRYQEALGWLVQVESYEQKYPQNLERIRKALSILPEYN